MQYFNVIFNSFYVCVECNFIIKKYDFLFDYNVKFYFGEINFKLKLIKRNNQIVLEQFIEVINYVVFMFISGFGSGDSDVGIFVSKIFIMKLGKSKVEVKKVFKKFEEVIFENYVEGIVRLVIDVVEIFSRFGGVEFFQDTLGYVMFFVQFLLNVNFVFKVFVSLNIIKYNFVLDTNVIMINFFNKFFYSIQVELFWLIVVFKYLEEYIRIWFVIQRLKYGISWFFEEVEEVRKKMFNGIIQLVFSTIIVLFVQLVFIKMSQFIFQIVLLCQIFGQISLVLIQVTSGLTIVFCFFITFVVVGVINYGQKRFLVIF